MPDGQSSEKHLQKKDMSSGSVEKTQNIKME